MQQLPADAAWRTDDSLLQPCADAENLLIYLDMEDESDTELDANVHVIPEEQQQPQPA